MTVKNSFYKIIFTVIFSFAFLIQSQQTDYLELEKLKNLNLHFRWEEIKGYPQYIYGPKIKIKKGQPVIELKPNKSAIFFIDSFQIFRIYSYKKKLSPNDLKIFSSNGSGIYCEEFLTSSKDRKSLLYYPGFKHQKLIKVSRPISSKEPILLTFYISQYHYPKPLVNYHPFTKIKGKKTKMKKSGQLYAQQFNLLSPMNPLSVEIKGPIRLQIRTHLKYNSWTSHPQEVYKIRCSLNSIYYQTLEFRASPGREMPYYVNKKNEPISQRRDSYLDIPKGTFSLKLSSANDIFVSIFSLRNKNMNKVAPMIEKKRVYQEPLILKRLLDANHRELGLSSWAIMQEKSKNYPIETTLKISTNDLWNHHTFFRPLLPQRKESRLPQVNASFLNHQLKNIENYPESRVLFSQFLSDELRNIANGYFIPIESGALGDKCSEIHYHVPQLGAPSILRLVVAPFSVATEHSLRLEIQVGSETPRILQFHPITEIIKKNLSISPLESVLNLLYNGTSNSRTSKKDELLHLYGKLDQFLPCLPAGHIELPLPTDTPFITIRRLDQGSDKPPLYISLAYRASRPYQLNQNEYLQSIKQGKQNISSFKLYCLESKKCKTIDPYFLAHHLPLKRFLQSRFRVFKLDIKETNERIDSEGMDSELTPNAAKYLRQEAINYSNGVKGQVNEMQWLLALENWNQLVCSGDVDSQNEALIERIHILIQMDELHLAEHFLKGILLFHPNKNLKNEAISLLLSLYQSAGDKEKQLNLRVVETFLNPDYRTIKQLCKILAENGEYQFALLTGMFLPSQEQPIDTLLLSAINTSQFLIFESLLNCIPEPRNLYWKGILAAHRGEYQKALTFLKKAGEPGFQWLERIKEGLAIAKQLFSKGSKLQNSILQHWQKWSDQSPGPWSWEDASEFIIDCAGTNTLYTIQRDLYATYFRFDQANSLILNVQGPMQLKFQFRRILSIDEVKDDNWVKLNINDQSQYIPLAEHQISSGLILIDHNNKELYPGNKLEWEISLGPGYHNISISSKEKQSILTRVYQYQPAIKINLLPPINPFTYSFIAQKNLIIPQKDIEKSKRKIYWIPKTDDTKEIDCDTRLWEDEIGSKVITEKNFFSTWGKIFHELMIENQDDAKIPINEDQKRKNEMVKYLWQMESEPKQANQWAAKAFHYYFNQPSRQSLYPFFNYLKKKSRWESVSSIIESSGLYAEKIYGWRPETPEISIRSSFLSPSPENEFVFTNTETAKIQLTNQTTIRLNVLTSLEVVGFKEKQPVTLYFSVDGKPNRVITLNEQMAQWSGTFSVPKGLHFFTIKPDKDYPNQFIRLKLSEGPKDNLSVSSPLVRRYNRFFHVSSQDTPIHIKVQTPSWLRIDELKKGRIWSQYLFVPKNNSDIYLMPQEKIMFKRPLGKKLMNPSLQQPVYHLQTGAFKNKINALNRLGFLKKFFPEIPFYIYKQENLHCVTTGDLPSKKLALSIQKKLGRHHIESFFSEIPPEFQESKYRIFKRIIDSDNPAHQLPRITTAPSILSLYPIKLNAAEKKRSVDMFDYFSLGRQEDPTWSLQVGGYDRRPFLEEIYAKGLRNLHDQYSQLMISRRIYHNRKKIYNHTDLLLRYRLEEYPTLGLRHQIQWRPQKNPLVFDFKTSAFMHKPSPISKYIYLPHLHWEWSFKLETGVRIRQHLDKKKMHLPGIRIFYRHLSLDQEEYSYSLKIDPDVYTPYKDDHQTGMTIEDTLLIRFKYKTLGWLNLGVTTNDDFNPMKPDYITAMAGWKQLINWIQLDIHYRWRRYFQDRDREQYRDSHLLSIQLFWDIWLKNRQRIELGGRWAREWGLKKNTLSFYMAWHLNQGKDYLDFNPTEIDFKNQKMEALFHKKNLNMNKIEK